VTAQSRRLAGPVAVATGVSTIEELDEAVLLERAGPGRDPAAFAELLRRHQGRVRGLLLRLSGGDRALADDLAQDVFLRAYRGLESFQGRARLSTWLYRIACNVYFNHRTRTRTTAPLPDGFESRGRGADVPSAGRCDLRRDLAAAIAALPERYRVVVTLHYVEELSYPEIAETLELPIGTIKTHLHRAKKLLRGTMSAWDGGGGAVDPA
jgi:RNA polymerase sigma-70 factor (ECF subfamily)